MANLISNFKPIKIELNNGEAKIKEIVEKSRETFVILLENFTYFERKL